MRVCLISSGHYTKASFPASHRRNESQQKDLLSFEKKYAVEMITQGDQATGFIAYWDLDSVIFIEHIVAANQEEKKIALEEFISKWEKEILLAVAPPSEEEHAANIEFYKSIGFKMNHFPFLQPPYDLQYPQIPLLFMTYKQTYPRPAFSIFKTKLIHEVYKQKHYKTIR